MKKSTDIRLIIALLLLYVLLLLLFWSRLGPDFWPLDRSFIGPNLLANVIWVAPVFLAGFLSGRKVWRHHKAHIVRQEAHNARQEVHSEWVAKLAAHNYRALTGSEPEQHPHFKV